ncbi:MAG: peptidoglycan editing factor PgeF [Chloroflexi bacterium]|nr:peptidoglycan editing factor PgeF [Chloroflexota bacterium]
MKRVANGPDSPVYYQFDFWRTMPLRHGVFTRLGGVSPSPWAALNVGGTVGDDPQAVAENIRRMYAVLVLAEHDVCTVWQVHGADTVIATTPPRGRKWLARADGMITDRTDIALSMRFADCVPVLFYDPQHHAIGLAHAGWRGTVAGAALSVVEALRVAYGSQPASLQAGIGPSIGPDRYQVGEEVVEAVQARFGTVDGLISRAEDGSAYLNLWEANRRLLEQAGVQQIESADICTASNTDEFFSHRAEKGKTGRFGVVLALDDQAG